MRKKSVLPKKTEIKKEEKKPSKPAAVKSEQKKEKKETSSFVLGLHNLKLVAGMHKRKKRLGRGSSSGHGKTSTRGSKGQTSRSGRDFYPGFEGGQMPLIRKIPKRGFHCRFKKEYQIVNLADLNQIKENRITLDLLLKEGLIKDKLRPVKILGDGEIKNPINISAHAFSKHAEEKIKQAGGSIELIHA